MKMIDQESLPFMLGSSYYPEQWPSDQWAIDFAKMKELGFNCMRMAEFAWSALEPSPDRFSFDWLEQALQLAGEFDIKVVLCTPTASIPPWLRNLYPDVLAADAQGDFTYGARKGHAFTHKHLLKRNDVIVSRMADAFGEHPQVIAWQLDNEPGYPFEIYGPVMLDSFRLWLREKYGCIEALNDAWHTSFWSHQYSTFEEIEFAYRRPCGGWNPEQRVDYRRFFSAAFSDYLSRQAGILRPKIGNRTIFTNWPNTHWSIDIWKTRSFLDMMTWDNYTGEPGIREWEEQLDAGFHHDLCRCASRQRRFMIAEQRAEPCAIANPMGIYSQTMSDIAHGAKGTIFFQWRQPAGGAERGFPSVLRQDGKFGRGKDAFRKISTTVAAMASFQQATNIQSDVALLYDFENSWEGGFWLRDEPGAGYDEETLRYYRGFRQVGLNMDVCPAYLSDDHDYRVIVAPGLRRVSSKLADQLNTFVTSGGTLILGPKTGQLDKNGKLQLSQAPGPLADLCGLEVVSSAGRKAVAGNLIDGLGNQGLTDQFVLRMKAQPDQVYGDLHCIERVELLSPDAEILGSISGPGLSTLPAIISHRVGKGRVIYVAVDVHDRKFHKSLAQVITELSGIRPAFAIPDGIELCSWMVHEGKNIYILLNHTEHVRTVDLPWTMQSILEQQPITTVSLEPFDAAFLLSTEDNHDQ